MKVCKVVINSVSHDARVLKEAEAIREAGFEVVILGIQDSNNNIPIQIMDNGIVIRRAAWQAAAFRPYLSELFGKIAIVIGVAVGLILLGRYLLYTDWEFVSSRGSWILTGANAFQLIGAILVLSALIFFLTQYILEYLSKSKRHRSLKKREEDELLKYAAIYRERKVEESAIRQLDANDTSATESFHTNGTSVTEIKKSSTQGTSLATKVPRPFMRGLIKTLSPYQIKRWSVIFAREYCIRRMLKEERPSIVHAHDLTALPLASKYAKKEGVKLIFDAHEIYDHLAQTDDEMAELNSLLLDKYAPSVDRFITINQSIANYYRTNYPKLPRAIVVKNAAKYAEPISYDGRLHEAAGLPIDRKIIIYQGGYAAKRGLIQLLMAGEYLNPEWSLVYMGWGSLEDELHRVADALILKNPAIAEKIRFVPKVKQDELPYWTAGATIGAIPYENTGLNHWFCNPNKLWEYPNAGVPIIASPFPEMSSIIDKYELGWYLPDPLNPKAIAEVINQLTEDQIKAASDNCFRFMKEDNWDVYAKRLKVLYGEIQ